MEGEPAKLIASAKYVTGRNLRGKSWITLYDGDSIAWEP